MTKFLSAIRFFKGPLICCSLIITSSCNEVGNLNGAKVNSSAATSKTRSKSTTATTTTSGSKISVPVMSSVAPTPANLMLNLSSGSTSIFVSNQASPKEFEEQSKTDFLVGQLKINLQMAILKATGATTSLTVVHGEKTQVPPRPSPINIVLASDVENNTTSEIMLALLPSLKTLKESSDPATLKERFAIVPVKQSDAGYGIWIVANTPPGISAAITYYLREVVGVKQILPMTWPDGVIFPKGPLKMVPTNLEQNPICIDAAPHFKNIHFFFGTGGNAPFYVLNNTWDHNLGPTHWYSTSDMKWNELMTNMQMLSSGNAAPGHSWSGYFGYLRECKDVSEGMLSESERNSSIKCPEGVDYAQLVSCRYFTGPEGSNPAPEYFEAASDPNCQVDETNFPGMIPYRITFDKSWSPYANELSWIPSSSQSIDTYAKWVVADEIEHRKNDPYEGLTILTQNDGNFFSQDSESLTNGTPIDQLFEIAKGVYSKMQDNPSLFKNGELNTFLTFMGYSPANTLPTKDFVDVKNHVLIGLANGFNEDLGLTYDEYINLYTAYGIKNIFSYDYDQGMEQWSNGVIPAPLDSLKMYKKRITNHDSVNGYGFEGGYSAPVGFFLSGMYFLNFHPKVDPEESLRNDFKGIFGPVWENLWDILQTYPSRKNYSITAPWLRLSFDKMNQAYSATTDESIKSSLNMIRLYMLVEYYSMRVLEFQTQRNIKMGLFDSDTSCHANLDIAKPEFSNPDSYGPDELDTMINDNWGCNKISLAELRASINGNVDGLYLAIDTVLNFVTRVFNTPKYQTAFAASTKVQYFCNDYQEEFKNILKDLDSARANWDTYIESLQSLDITNASQIESDVNALFNSKVMPFKNKVAATLKKLNDNWCNGVSPLEGDVTAKNIIAINTRAVLTDIDISNMFQSTTNALHAIPLIPVADFDPQKNKVIPADPNARCTITDDEAMTVTAPYENNYKLLVLHDSTVVLSTMMKAGKEVRIMIYNTISEDQKIVQKLSRTSPQSDLPVRVTSPPIRLAAGEYRLIQMANDENPFGPQIQGVNPTSNDLEQNGTYVRMYSDFPSNYDYQPSFIFHVPESFSGSKAYFSLDGSGARVVLANSGFLSVVESVGTFPACQASNSCWTKPNNAAAGDSGIISYIPNSGGVFGFPVKPGKYYKIGGNIERLVMVNFPQMLSLSASCSVGPEQLNYFP